MMFGPGMGFHGAFGFLAGLISVLFFLLCLAVVIGLIFLLVRFLLVGTRAAQLYVAQHEPAKPAATETIVTARPAAAPATTTAPATAAKPATTTKPATTSRPRTPKAPPAS